MKTFILVLCLVAVIAAKGGSKKDNQRESGEEEKRNGSGEGPRGPAPPGCENPPKDIKLSDCCKDFPSFFSKKEIHETCKDTCKDSPKGQEMCCKSECALNAAGVLTDGKFNADKSKAQLANSTYDKALIASIVDGCAAKGPESLKNWRSKAPQGKGPNCTEDTSLNMVISHCIRRELFFQCPGMDTSDKCQALVKFGKSCPMFPFHGGCRGGKEGKGGKKEKKEGKDKKEKKEGNDKKEKKEGKDMKDQKKEEKKSEKQTQKEESKDQKAQKDTKKDQKPQKDEKKDQKPQKDEKKDQKPQKDE